MRYLAQIGESSYLALIGDIRRSRQVADRQALQLELERGLVAVNDRWGDRLASQLVITLGDEFQGLLGEAADACAMLVDLERELSGIPIRFGLGWGSLTTKWQSHAVGMDGPCFHRAREAVEFGKKKNRWATIAGFNDEDDQIMNGLLGLIGAQRNRWTQRQAEIVSQVRQVNSRSCVAEQLGVKPPTITKALKAALYLEIMEAEAALVLLLRRAAKQPPGVESHDREPKA